jgi:Tol biopolymer transport system component
LPPRAPGAAPKPHALLLFVRWQGEADSRLYLLDVDTRRETRVTRQDAVEPDWSCDGARIAYSTDLATQDFPALAIATLKGTLHRVLSEEGSYNYPAWSPSGRLIAFEFIANDGSRNPMPEVGVVGSDGRGQRILGPDVGDTRPTWSPESKRLAYAGPDGLRVVSPRGGASRLVAPDAFQNPAWSPRGTKIAFVSPKGLEVVRPDGTGRQVVARVAGRRIAFVDFTNYDGGPIYVVSAGGGEPQRVTPASDDDTEPVWRPRA